MSVYLSSCVRSFIRLSIWVKDSCQSVCLKTVACLSVPSITAPKSNGQLWWEKKWNYLFVDRRGVFLWGGRRWLVDLSVGLLPAPTKKDDAATFLSRLSTCTGTPAFFSRLCGCLIQSQTLGCANTPTLYLFINFTLIGARVTPPRRTTTTLLLLRSPLTLDSFFNCWWATFT